MWQDQFFNLLSSAAIAPEHLERAIELRDAHLPPKLYKLRPVNNYALDNLQNDTVWLCSPERYNDPYECSLAVSHEVLSREASRLQFDSLIGEKLRGILSEEELESIRGAADPLDAAMHTVLSKDSSIPAGHHDEIIRAAIAAAKTIHSKSVEALNGQMRQAVKMCSFTTRNDSIVMWGHYAQGHTGFCMEYDIQSWPVPDVRRSALYPVIYSPKIFDSTDFIVRRLAGEQISPLMGAISALCKSTDWSYENEWRLLFPFGLIAADTNYCIPTPSAIYIGSKSSDADVKRLRAIASSKSIPAFRMILDREEFRMTPQPFPV